MLTCELKYTMALLPWYEAAERDKEWDESLHVEHVKVCGWKLHELNVEYTIFIHLR